MGRAYHVLAHRLAVEPFHLVLWTFMELEDAERLEREVRLARDLNQAVRVAEAMHAPERVFDERDELRERLFPAERVALDRATAMEVATMLFNMPSAVLPS